jgi:hypothetical protein
VIFTFHESQHCNLGWINDYELLFVQVKTFLVGAAFVGEVPLYHMILAALITG